MTPPLRRKVRPMVRSSRDQIMYLCHYMRKHPELAAGNYKSPQRAVVLDRQWSRLKADLDKLGRSRTVEQWKIAWRDQKRKAKVNSGTAKRTVTATGNIDEASEISENNVVVLGTFEEAMSTSGSSGESTVQFSVSKSVPALSPAPGKELPGPSATSNKAAPMPTITVWPLSTTVRSKEVSDEQHTSELQVKTFLRSSAAQIRFLVDYMRKNPKMARLDNTAHAPSQVAMRDFEWHKLKDELKEYGPDRDMEQWKLTWRDLKKKAKQDWAKIQEAKQQNPDSDDAQQKLSLLNTVILQAIGHGDFESEEGNNDTAGDDITTSRLAKIQAKLQATSNGNEEGCEQRVKQDPLDYEIEVLEDKDFDSNASNAEEDTNTTQAESHFRPRPSAPPQPRTRTRRKCSSPTPSRSPSPHRRKRTSQENETMCILDKFIEYEREKERLAHEKEMSRIAQNDKVVKMLGRMVTVLESLAPNLQRHLNDKDNSPS